MHGPGPPTCSWPPSTTSPSTCCRRAVRTEVEIDAMLGPSTAAIVSRRHRPGHSHIRLNDGNLVQLGYGAPAPHLDRRDRAHQRHRRRHRQRTRTSTKACCPPAACRFRKARSSQSRRGLGGRQDIGLPVVVKARTATMAGRESGPAQESKTSRPPTRGRPEGSDVMVERASSPATNTACWWWTARWSPPTWANWSASPATAIPRRRTIRNPAQPDPRRGIEAVREIIDGSTGQACRWNSSARIWMPNRCPQPGVVVVQRNGNMALDCTDDVHPEVAHMACAGRARWWGWTSRASTWWLQDIASRWTRRAAPLSK